MTYTQHLENIKAAREALEAIGQFKPSYANIFVAVENSLAKLASVETKMPVVARLKAQLDSKKESK